MLTSDKTQNLLTMELLYPTGKENLSKCDRVSYDHGQHCVQLTMI